jgi:Zn-dependent metalloprotease
MRGLRTGLAFGVLLTIVVTSGQTLTAVASPAPARSSPSGRAQTLAAEQSVAASSGQALKLGNGEKLVAKDVIADPDGSTHVRYDRTFNGLRVIGGDLVSHRDSAGAIEGVSWNGTRQVAVASTSPKVSLASARAAGTRTASLAQKTTAATKGELVVYSGGAAAKAPARLAYDVLTTGVRADQTPSRLHTIVDAGTGATITSWDEIQNGTGHSIYVGTVPIDTTGAPGSYSMSDAAGNDTTDLNGSGDGSGDDIWDVPGTTFTDADNVWGNGAVSDRASAGVDAHYGAEKTFDYFKTVLGRNGISNDGAGARSRVHYGNAYENAFWDGTQMTYGDGAGNTHPLVALDVAGHEMTHGVTQNTAALVYTGDAGGLNEATSDIFGTSVEFYADNAADTPDYLLGERLDFNGNGTPLRYMDRPSRDDLSPDCWSPAVGELDPHESSGPLNHWFYLASEGSGPKVVKGVSYDSPTCNASFVAPIGRDAAAKIWYRTLTTYLTSGSTYADAREGAIQSAKELYGAASRECTGTAASFSAIDVPPGAQVCAVATPPSPGNMLRNPGFESGATSWTTTPDVIDAWGVDFPNSVHSGTWGAWMGGYGVVHTDKISQSVTIPAGRRATLSYHVLIGTDEPPGSAALDTLKVRTGSTVLQTLSNRNAASFYQLRTVSLSAYAGQTIVLSFTGTENASLSTMFILDDLAVTLAPTVSGAPTAVAATPENAGAVVSWKAPTSNGGTPITGYKVTAAPGGATATTTGARTATVTGLTNGTAYTFRVTAANAIGASLPSVASAPLTPRTVPVPPTDLVATAGNSRAVVSWDVPSNDGGSPITGYTVTADPGGRTAATTGTSTATVTGLTNGTAYTFTVTAANAAGTSANSEASAAVTPAVTAPDAPTNVVAAHGNTESVVSWRAPVNDGGLPNTGYSVTAAPGGATATTTGATTATFTGLTNGTTYRFRVTATNAAGTSASSAASAAVTPSSDFTGDDKADVLAIKSSGQLYRYTGNGLGGFAGPGVQMGTGWGTFAKVFSPGDFTGDGRADVLAIKSSGQLYRYTGNGLGGFAGPGVQMGTGWGTFAKVFSPGDFTGDGKADVLAIKSSGQLYRYTGNGLGGFAGPGVQMGTGWGTFATVF